MEVSAELSSGNLRAGTDSREPREGFGAVQTSDITLLMEVGP
jgi:hypothetical protein